MNTPVLTRLTPYPFYADRVGIDTNRLVVTGTNSANGYTLGVQLSTPPNLSRPNLAALFEEAGPIWTGVTVQSGRAYAARNNAGLVILDLSDLGIPKVVAKIPLPGFARSVAVQGDYAYIATTTTGVQIVKLSGGAVVASVPNPPGSGANSYCTGLAVSGNLLLMACGNQVRVVSIADPEHPVVGATLANPYASGNLNSAVIQGSMAYLSAGTAGLVALDLSNPSQPSMVGNISEGGLAVKVAVEGRRAYVANTDSLWVVDVSAPSAMLTLEKWKNTDSVLDVALLVLPAAKYLVAACGKAGVAAFKV